MSFYSGSDERKSVAALLAASFDHRQHRLDKATAARTLRSKRRLPPNHRMAQRTLAGVVRGLNRFMPHKRPQPPVMLIRPTQYVPSCASSTADDPCKAMQSDAILHIPDDAKHDANGHSMTQSMTQKTGIAFASHSSGQERRLTEQVGYRLRWHGLRGRTVQLKVRFALDWIEKGVSSPMARCNPRKMSRIGTWSQDLRVVSGQEPADCSVSGPVVVATARRPRGQFDSWTAPAR